MMTVTLMRNSRPLYALLIFAVLAAGCSRAGAPPGSDQPQATLKISMIPTTDPGKMLRESQPLIAYLQQETGAKIELTIPTN
jgi:ABC-type phosphate/phosphonate transport system substrate-binding protein